MKSLSLAGTAALAGLASLGAQAQAPAPPAALTLDPQVVTATRSLSPAATTLREATVITREEIEAAGPIGLAELLQRRAGVEIRATGGPGQPVGLFLRGTGTAQTLVLVDGLRVGSATIGTTSIENIPLELIERIELVKGPLSSLYGSEAIGGVVQVFTRGKKVPHLHASAGYGENSDGRLAAGLAGADERTSFSLAAGGRTVDAPSATNPRSYCYDPDRDPYENAFASGKFARRLWQGETIEFNAFGSRGRTHFDGCPDAQGLRHDDRNDQSILGVGLASSTQFAAGWSSRLAFGHGRDRIETTGAYPSLFETRQDQVSWVNEFVTPRGSALAGIELLRQDIVSDVPFTTNRREVKSAFTGLTEDWGGQRVEASIRRDEHDAFGAQTSGSASYGVAWPGVGRLSATYGEGFRAPTFYDLHGPSSPFYRPNPDLLPERSESWEIALRAEAGAAIAWRLTVFDHRIEDLITYDAAAATQRNVERARIKGVEASAEASWLGARWRANATLQQPRNDLTGLRLQGRADAFGTVEATRSFGTWTAGLVVFASTERYDSADESPASRLPGYARVDARLRYAINKEWSATLTASNLLDRQYETAVGYDAPRRQVFLAVSFEAF